MFIKYLHSYETKVIDNTSEMLMKSQHQVYLYAKQKFSNSHKRKQLVNRQILIEQRIYCLHQIIIQKLRNNPQPVMKMAQSNLKRYIQRNGDWPSYLDWQQKLSLPVEDIIKILESDEESAILARSNSPFAGSLSPRERWAILRKFNQEHET